MIEIVPVDGLYDKEYISMMKEFEEIRSDILRHKFQISMQGTGSYSFSIIDSFLSAFKWNKFLTRVVRHLMRKLTNYMISRKKVLISYLGHVWTSEAILQSTLPYPVRRTEYPWAIKNSKLDKPMKILDVGSGISLFPIYLSSKGHKVTSIDNDEILMNRVSPNLAKWAGTNVDYALGNVTKLEFEDETFDRVFCISVLEHLEEEKIDGKVVNYRKKNFDVKAIEEMFRVLKSKGLLILTFDWSENPDDGRSFRLQDIYDRVFKNYTSFLLTNERPEVNWDKLKEKHLQAGKNFPPYTYVHEGWAIGAVLIKK